jgi:hypothetical protein
VDRLVEAMKNRLNASVALHKEGSEFVSEGRRKVVMIGEVVDLGPAKDESLDALQERVEKLEAQARGEPGLVEAFEALPKDQVEAQRLLRTLDSR